MIRSYRSNTEGEGASALSREPTDIDELPFHFIRSAITRGESISPLPISIRYGYIFLTQNIDDILSFSLL